MLMIYARTMSAKGQVENVAISASDFKDRKDAVVHLEKLIEQFKPNSGYEGEQDYWWIRENGVVTRYTIGS